MSSAYEHVFQDGTLTVAVMEDGKNPTIQITDRKSGRQWGPVALLALDVYDRPCRRTERVGELQIEQVEAVSGGVHVTVSSPYHAVDVGLWVRLIDGELSVVLQPAEVYERRPELFRVFAVDVMPGLLDIGSAGQLLLPIRSGMQASPANKPKLADRFLIYLEQERWELCTMLPFCAASENGSGMVVVAVQGACDCECRVETDGNGRGHVGFAISLRRTWYDPVDFGLREYRYAPLPKDADPVVFTAKRIRRHVMEDLHKPTLKERIKESPEVAYLAEAYVMKLFHAVEVGERPLETRTVPSFQACMTFAEAEDCLKRLHTAGIDRIVTHNVGWHVRGGDGLFPTRFPIDERLGGERGLRDMVAFGNRIGYNISFHDDYMMNTPNAPDWDKDSIIHDVAGQPLLGGCWALGLDYESWPLAMSEARISGEMQRAHSLGIRGVYCLDYMMRPLEVNYHLRHRGPRSKHAQGQLKIIETAKKIFGGVAVEFGPLPAAVAADYVQNDGSDALALRPEWPVTKLVDRPVQVWQLALHGLTMSEAGAGPTWPNSMRAMLYGLKLRDEWHARKGRNELTDGRIKAQKACYDLCVKRFGHLVLEELTDTRQIGDEIHSSKYSDGTEVNADFAKQELFVNGKNIPMPEALK